MRRLALILKKLLVKNTFKRTSGKEEEHDRAWSMASRNFSGEFALLEVNVLYV